MDEYDDPKIALTPERAKLVAQVICGEIKHSLEHSDNKRRYDMGKRFQNQYNQVTKWMASGKTCDAPWKNAADYFIAMSEWTVDAVWARGVSMLFSQEPIALAKGTEGADVPNEEGVTDFVDMIHREVVRIYDTFKFFMKQIIILPFAVLKYEWTQDYDRMIIKEDALVFTNQITGQEEMLLQDDTDAQTKSAELIANGYVQSGMKPMWVSQDKELINAPQLKYVRFEDYVYSPSAKRGNRLYWEGDRFWLTINEMLLKAQQDKFIPDSVEKVKNQVSYADKAGAERAIAQREALVESFHWWGRLPFDKNNEVDFEGADTIEQEVYAVVSYKEEELLQIMHWPYRRIPWPDRVYIRGEFEETENFEGRSLLQKLYMTQKYMNDTFNNIMNNAYLSMMKIFVKKRSLTGEEWEKPDVYPGAIWEEDMTGDIRALEIGDVKAIGLEINQMFINYAERISNISLYQTGTARETGQKTKGEVDATIAEGNLGLDKYVQNCFRLYRKICQWTVAYYYDRMPEGLERRIRGENDQMIFPTAENMGQFNQKEIQPYWQKDNLAGSFDWSWSSSSLNASKDWKINVANDLMARYLPVPMVGGNMLATWEILKMGLQARGIKDWQKILPPREAIIQEMQAMQAKAAQPQPVMRPA